MVPMIYVLSENKNITFFNLKINIFTAVQYCMGVSDKIVKIKRTKIF